MKSARYLRWATRNSLAVFAFWGGIDIIGLVAMRPLTGDAILYKPIWRAPGFGLTFYPSVSVALYVAFQLATS